MSPTTRPDHPPGRAANGALLPAAGTSPIVAGLQPTEGNPGSYAFRRDPVNTVQKTSVPARVRMLAESMASRAMKRNR